MSVGMETSAVAPTPAEAAGTVSEARAFPRLPELLAPAGDWECVRAAVENGADAVYFGLDKFNARMRARNFTESDLPGLMEFLHKRGVQGYVTFNTLVFENEMDDAEQYLRVLIRAGVDAAIVQDVGMCRLIRLLSRDFPIHVSTQMTVTSSAGLDFARDLGCDLVVLARECSLGEIERMQARQATCSRPLPLEVFVHGALCVAYSGQCLTSEALGGRSANRGECAQACRMPYELIADGQRVELGDRKYLLSPQDLAGLDLVPELIRLRIASLKIEGRLKSPEYVASITRLYREALDRVGKPDSAPRSVDPARDRYEMEMAFSRGLYTGWFRGTNNQELVHGRFGKKRGVYVGEVLAVEADRVLMQRAGPLKPGDGVVFDAGNPEITEEGGRIYEITPGLREFGPPRKDNPALALPDDARVWLRFGGGAVSFRRIRPGHKVWKTSDPELERRLRQSFEGEIVRHTRPVRLEVLGREGEPLRVLIRDTEGNVAEAASQMPLEKARNQPLTPDRLREQMGRLGGTPFHLASLEAQLAGDLLLPISELNRLRRELVSRLEALRARPARWQLTDQAGTVAPRFSIREGVAVGAADPEFVILVRNLSQLEAALRENVRTVYCDFEDPKKYRQAVQVVRAWQPGVGQLSPEVFVAPPRIFKTGEDWVLQQVRSSEADGYLVRNYDHLTFFAGERRIGDYSLNIANRLSADYFKHHFGLERLTASYDLNVVQLHALLRGAPPEWFEISVHQHMPMFHMEHCIFCAFLSRGKDYRDCGRPCDSRVVRLRDRVGAAHPVKADAGCRNTVYNALAQTGAEFLRSFMELGVRRFRLEFLDELPEQVAKTIQRYRQVARGEITGQQLWREFRLLNQLGVTRGQLPAKAGA